MPWWRISSREKMFVIVTSSVMVWLVLTVTTGTYDIDWVENRRGRQLLPRYKTKVEVRGSKYMVHSQIEDRKWDVKAMRQQLQKDIMNRQAMVESWRPHLVAKRGMLGLKRDEDDSVFRALKPEHKFSMKCGTCAVVSNTDLLNRGNEGKNIDSADCVFRFGAPFAENHAKHAGKKHTFSMMSVRNFTTMNAQKAENTILFDCDSDEQCQNLDTNAKTFFLSEKGHKMAKSMFDNENVKYGHDRTKDGPSAVWYTLLVMKHVGCSRTTFYGFPSIYFCRKRANRKHKQQYWNKNSAKVCTSDNREAINNLDLATLEEKKLLHRWAWNYRITFQQPSW